MDAPFSYLAAFATGVASFLAPCTLALVPLYLSYLGGFTLAEQVDSAQSRNQVAMAVNILLFSLGFTVVFVALGASLGTLSAAVVTFSPWLNQVSGVFIILMGLITLGLIQTPTFIPWFKPQQATGVRFPLAGLLPGGRDLCPWVDALCRPNPGRNPRRCWHQHIGRLRSGVAGQLLLWLDGALCGGRTSDRLDEPVTAHTGPLVGGRAPGGRCNAHRLWDITVYRPAPTHLQCARLGHVMTQGSGEASCAGEECARSG